MITDTIHELITELDHAVATGDTSRRQQMLRRITDLFVAAAPSAEAALMDLFGAVLGRLASRADIAAREELSARIAPIDNAPRGMVIDLASAREARVAAPVLRRSRVLAEGDLVRIATDCGDDYRIAIAEREVLTEPVTDVLVERGGAQVVQRVAQNLGARFSGRGYSILIDRARFDEALTATLWTRRDLPAAAIKALVTQAADSAIGRTGALPAAARDALEDLATGVVNAADARMLALQEARLDVRTLAERKALDPGIVQTFAIEGRYEHALAAYAELCAVPTNMVLRFWQPNGAELVLITAKAAGLPWSTARAALRAVRRGSDLSGSELATASSTFNKLQAPLCQRIVRFWKARETACRSEAAA